jgi:hypothetical protein
VSLRPATMAEGPPQWIGRQAPHVHLVQGLDFSHSVRQL